MNVAVKIMDNAILIDNLNASKPNAIANTTIPIKMSKMDPPEAIETKMGGSSTFCLPW